MATALLFSIITLLLQKTFSTTPLAPMTLIISMASSFAHFIPTVFFISFFDREATKVTARPLFLFNYWLIGQKIFPFTS